MISFSPAAAFCAALLLITRYASPAAENADAVTCQHLKIIHRGLVKYLQMHESVWPQIPAGLDLSGSQKWWIQTLKPCGVSLDDWSDPRDEGKSPEERMAYTLAMFSKEPHAAEKLASQPWAMTSSPSKVSGDFQLLLADGRVMGQKDFVGMERTAPLSDGRNKTTVEHLRGIHEGLTKYLKAHSGIWPQPPDDLEAEAEAKWFEEALKPYGIKPDDWEDPWSMINPNPPA